MIAVAISQKLGATGVPVSRMSQVAITGVPPPVIARMLQTLLHKLRRGGGFLFQVPTQPPGYSFDTADYLQRPNAVGASFEMHALPMHAALDIIADAGGRVKEVVSDNWTGALGSHTFFGTKP